MTLSACNTQVTETTTSSSTSKSTSSSLRFADGTKAVRINTQNGASSVASFDTPTMVPTSTVIPTTFPGANGTLTYLPGVSAARYFELDGVTGLVSKPDWLLDFQLGITTFGGSSGCAGFGNAHTLLEPSNFYRTDEFNCASVANGNGSGTDQVFFRILLDRTETLIGTGENLLVQVEYQASGLRLNTDGAGTDVEENLDQLWKIFWSDSLANTATPKTFGVFVPPNYAACESSGTGNVPAGSVCLHGSNNYRGSPVKVRQFVIPISAYPTMKVIQFSRVKGRINSPSSYVSSFCAVDEPLCLGVVIRSVSIMRI